MHRITSLSKRFSVALLTIAMLGAPGLVPRAEASFLSLSFGGGFRIGGIHFNVGVHSRAGRYHDHYYRTSHRLRYDGYSCNRSCYRQERHTYHHRACPIVNHHFKRHGYVAQDVFDSYAPRYEGRNYHRRSRSYDSYDRYDRYDRRGRSYDRRNRSYDRYDRRSRGRSCDRPRYDD